MSSTTIAIFGLLFFQIIVAAAVWSLQSAVTQLQRLELERQKNLLRDLVERT